MKTIPGLKLKQRVRDGELTAQEALQILRNVDPRHAVSTQNATVRWLMRRGAV
jgi:hypothetical protein